MAKLVFKTCPVCGSEPVILRDNAGGGEDNFYIGRCPNTECVLYNEDTYDDLKACCDAWNAKVAQYAPQTEETEGEDEDES